MRRGGCQRKCQPMVARKGLQEPTRRYATWPLSCGNTTREYCGEIAARTSNPRVGGSNPSGRTILAGQWACVSLPRWPSTHLVIPLGRDDPPPEPPWTWGPGRERAARKKPSSGKVEPSWSGDWSGQEAAGPLMGRQRLGLPLSARRARPQRRRGGAGALRAGRAMRRPMTLTGSSPRCAAS
jgi:hypothetical protein